MNRVITKVKFVIVISLIILFNSCTHKTERITGTIGKEKLGNDQIVICVFGTKACLPVKIDPEQTVKFQGKETKLTNLPFGLYLETEMIVDKEGKKIKNISIDESKTVICFNELNQEQELKLNQLLKDIKGVKTFKVHPESIQVYIEFEPQTITYIDLENKIKNEGFELE
ncbi:MAG: hypothetical protein WC644_04450 [Ignavibacteria bacterium]